jgi:phosphoglycolate phosphatase
MQNRKRRIRYALFDFDGTLADSADWFIETLQASAQKLGYRRLGKEDIQALRGLNNREIVRRLGVPAWRMTAIARHFRAEAARSLGRIRPFPDAIEALETLHEADIRLGILTSNTEPNVRAVLGERAASLVSDFACGSSLFGKATKLRRLVRRSGIAAAETIAIGDETRDTEAARAAGVTAAAVTWGYATRAALEAGAPDLIFDNFAALTDALKAGA